MVITTDFGSDTFEEEQAIANDKQHAVNSGQNCV
jgi:hypothetical protein